MPCCVLQHPETKDFVRSLEAAEEAGEGRSGHEGWGLVFEILEMNFHPNRIMFIFSAVPFIIHSPPPLICMKLKIVGIFFFFQEIMFLECLLQSFKLSCLNSAVTPMM